MAENLGSAEAFIRVGRPLMITGRTWPCQLLCKMILERASSGAIHPPAALPAGTL